MHKATAFLFSHRRAAILVLVLSLPLPKLEGQTGSRLQPAQARLGEEFSRIVGVRELRDGRVLIADAGDKRLVVADFSRNTVTQIGREGRGPNEYVRLSALRPLGPDSTLLSDLGNRRWLVLHQDRIVGMISADHPAIVATRADVGGADARGRVLSTTPPPIREGGLTIGRGDSVVALLVNLSSGATDTVARLRAAPLTVWTEVDAAGKVTRAGINRPPFAVGEEAFLFSDGWIAVARLDPYRVDWRATEGGWVRGALLPFAEQAVTQRERQAYLTRLATLMGRPQTAPPADSWPDVVPPFQPSPFVPAPDGSALILRTPTASHPGHRYDRVDRRGVLTGWVELLSTEQLLGVGARGAYVAVTDESGIQRVQRHPWP